MKKKLVLGMVIVMVMAVFAGCGQNGQVPGTADPYAQEQQQEQSQQTQPQVQEQAAQNSGNQDQQDIVYEDGVAMNPADYDLISEDEAKRIALAKVEGASVDNLSRIDLDYDDRRWIYEGEIYYGDWEYEFEINAENGNIIGFEKDHIYD